MGPLDKGSVHRRNFYPTTHNIPKSPYPTKQSHASGRGAIEIGIFFLFECKMSVALQWASDLTGSVTKIRRHLSNFDSPSRFCVGMSYLIRWTFAAWNKLYCEFYITEKWNSICTCSQLATHVLQAEVHIWNCSYLLLDIRMLWVQIRRRNRTINYKMSLKIFIVGIIVATDCPICLSNF
jgi:hypothetical protein